MFKRKSNSPPPPKPLTFNKMLQDLKQLQLYQEQQLSSTTTKDENYVDDILDLIDELEINPPPTISSLLSQLNSLYSSAMANTTEEKETAIESTYDLCTNFININDYLNSSRPQLDSLGLEIESIRKEVTEMIDILNNVVEDQDDVDKDVVEDVDDDDIVGGGGGGYNQRLKGEKENLKKKKAEEDKENIRDGDDDDNDDDDEGGWKTDCRAVGITVKVEGEEYLDVKPAIFICNHQATADLLVLGKVFPKNCTVIGKSSLKYVPFLNLYMKLGQGIFLDRKNHQNATSVFIFPEGTRARLQEADLLPFKKGAFHMAVRAKIPIVPIVVGNYSHLYDSKRRLFKSGEFRVRVLPPIDTSNMNEDDRDEINNLTNLTREEMLRTLKDI
ncbi:254_t:CDS:2 [Entrophospora sp. SA101]|nr:11167_t:CDS:2 [Entrophospora sp. SA101]CAJ0919763.1 254_t:CDS:2 [Entrophospora sp. SA101]